MEFTDGGRRRWDTFVADLARAVVGLDFDGTLSPIVDDPEAAHIHPEAGEVLVALAQRVRAVAVITGRPARQVLDLGGLEEVGRAFADVGKDLYVFGQYGNERWCSGTGEVLTASPPDGLADFERELPGLLDELDAGDAWIEDKGLAVAVHTRRLQDSRAAFDRLLPALRERAERHGLSVEPGRNVIEVRAPGVHKGGAVSTLVEELGAAGFCFGGDDLGDVEAFDELDRLDETGFATLRVCVASDEESALQRRADVIVHGPEGVLELLRALVDAP